MKCAEIENLLDQFVGDELDFAFRRKVSEHLNECADCRSAAEKLQSSAHLLKNLPLIAPSNQLDARMMQAFRKHQETQNRPNFRTSFLSLFSMSKPALACAALLLIAFTALAFQLGRMSAPNKEIANNKTIEPATPIVQIVEKQIEVPVIKTVEVPVYKDKVVTRVVYKNRHFVDTTEKSNMKRNKTRENIFESQNTAVTFVENGNETFTPINLKDFQPVTEIKMDVIKRSKENEKQ